MKAQESKSIEYSSDDDDSLIGKVVVQNDEFVYAEILDHAMFHLDDVKSMRVFLDEVESWIEGETNPSKRRVASYDLPIGDGSTIEISKPTTICGVAPFHDKIRIFITTTEGAPKVDIEVFYAVSGDVPIGATMVGVCQYGRIAVCVFIREVHE